MSEIDPQEFGELKARVELLLKSDTEKAALLRELSENVTAMRLEMAEMMGQVRGGWKLLTAIASASTVVGGGITWALTHLTTRG